MKKQKICLLLFAILALGVLFAGSVMAIGMMTEPIVFRDVLRGQQLRATLTLLNSETKADTYELSSEGQIAGWVKFYAISDTKLANSVEKIQAPLASYFDVLAVLEVPKDARNGVYKGSIVVTSGASEASTTENQATVRQSVSREVRVEITGKEIIKLESQIIPLNYSVNAGKPLNIKVIYENQGNVELKPEAKLLITKEDQTIFEATFPYPPAEQAVKSLERKVFDPLLTWQTAGQGAGKYQAKVEVLLNGAVVGESVFSLQINSLQDQILSMVAMIGFGKLGLGWLFIGLGLMILVFVIEILIFIFKNKKNKKNL